MKLYLQPILLFAIIVLLSSCEATQAFQRAQTAFSQGAELEMRDRFEAAADQMPANFVYFDDLYKSASSADPGQSSASYYEAALEEVATALKGKGQLKKAFALDNAYAIKSLALWRRGNYEEAKAVAEKAVPLLSENRGEENDIRDLAMMKALPGLVNMDQSFGAVEKIEAWGNALSDSSDSTERQNLYTQIKETYIAFASSEEDGASSIARGLALIERAIEQMEGESAIDLYLINAQLAGMDNWGDMLQVVFLSARRLNDSPEEMAWGVSEREAYNTRIRSYLQKLENRLPNGKENKLYNYWVRLLAGS